jgi:hypothetical protein
MTTAQEIEALQGMLMYENYIYRRNRLAGVMSEGNEIRRAALIHAIELLEQENK